MTAKNCLTNPHIGKFAKTWSTGVFIKERLWSAWWRYSQGHVFEAEAALEDIIQIIVKENKNGQAPKPQGEPQGQDGGVA